VTALVQGGVGLTLGSAAFLAVHVLLSRRSAVDERPTDVHPPVWPALGMLGLFAAVEEAVFRIGVLGLGSRVVGFPAAFGLSVLLFAVVHRAQERLSALAWVNLGLVGALLGLLYRHGGFWAALGFHWAWNGWEWGLGYAVSGELNRSRLPAPPVVRHVRRLRYGPEAHWAASAVLGTSLVVLVVLAR